MKFVYIIIFQLLTFGLFAQNKTISNQEFSLSFGGKEYFLQRFEMNENIDFLNYFDTLSGAIDYGKLTLGYKFDLFNKISTDIRLILLSDLAPDNFYISSFYSIHKKISVGVGCKLNKFYISYFDEYHRQQFKDYSFTDNNQRQFSTYDFSFFISPMFKIIDNEKFSMRIKTDLGFSKFFNESAIFLQKKKLSNEKIKYTYSMQNTFQPYIQPKLEMSVKLFTIKNTAFGLLFNSGYTYSKRRNIYSKTINKWIDENGTFQKIKSPFHNYSYVDFDFGIYIKLVN